MAKKQKQGKAPLSGQALVDKVKQLDDLSREDKAVAIYKTKN